MKRSKVTGKIDLDFTKVLQERVSELAAKAIEGATVSEPPVDASNLAFITALLLTQSRARFSDDTLATCLIKAHKIISAANCFSALTQMFAEQVQKTDVFKITFGLKEAMKALGFTSYNSLWAAVERTWGTEKTHGFKKTRRFSLSLGIGNQLFKHSLEEENLSRTFHRQNTFTIDLRELFETRTPRLTRRPIKRKDRDRSMAKRQLP